MQQSTIERIKSVCNTEELEKIFGLPAESKFSFFKHNDLDATMQAEIEQIMDWGEGWQKLAVKLINQYPECLPKIMEDEMYKTWQDQIEKHSL